MRITVKATHDLEDDQRLVKSKQGLVGDDPTYLCRMLNYILANANASDEHWALGRVMTPQILNTEQKLK